MSVLGDAVIRITASAANFGRGIQAAVGHVGKLADAAQTAASALQSIGVAALKMSAALTTALTPAIVQGAKFEQAMAGVKAVLTDVQGASSGAATRFAELTAEAKRLGATTVFTATEVASAMEFLGLAGFNSSEIMGGLQDTLDLAAAGALDLGRAADLASDTMIAFGLSAEDLDRVVDVFAATATNANTNVNTLGEAMKLVAPIASTLGQDVEQVATALGILADGGIKGSIAGAGLAQGMAQLAKKGEDANKVLTKYGITFEDVNPEVVSLRDIIARFEEVNLSAGDAMTLFGARAGRTMLLLKNQGVQAFDALHKITEEAAGSAQRMAEIRMDTVIGSFKTLKAAIEALNIGIFDSFKETLRDTIKTMTEWVQVGVDWVSKNQAIAGTIAVLMGAAAAALAVFGTFAVVVASVAAAIAGLVLIGASAITWALALVAGMSVLGATLTAVIVPLLISMKSHVKALGRVFQTVWKNAIKPMWEGFRDTLRDVWISTVLPVFRELEAAMGRVVATLQEGADGLAKYSSTLQYVGETIAWLIGNGIALFLMHLVFLVEMLGGVISAVGWLADVLIRLTGALVGYTFAAKDDTSLADKFKKDAEAARELTEAITRLTEVSRERVNKAKLANAQDRKAIALLEDFDKLSVVQAKKLAELMAAKAADLPIMRARLDLLKEDAQLLETAVNIAAKTDKREAARLTNQLDRVKQQITEDEKAIERLNIINEIRFRGAEAIDEQRAALEQSMAARKDDIALKEDELEVLRDANQSTRVQLAELDKLLELQASEGQQLRDLISMNRRYADIMKEVGGDTARFAERIEELREIFIAAADAEEELEASTKKFDDLVKEVNTRKLSGLAGEFQKTRELRAEQEELLNTQERLIKTSLEGLKERFKDIASYEEGEAKVKQYNEAIEKQAKLEEDLDKIKATRAAADRAAAASEAATVKKAANSRRTALRDAEIADLRRRGKDVSAQRLDNAKILEEEKIKNDKLFEMDGVNNARIRADRKKLEAIQADAASARLRKVMEDRAGKGGVLKSEKDLETSITNQLVKRVTTLQDIFMLYDAIGKLRLMQERRAFKAAEKTAKLEERLDTLRKRRENLVIGGGDPTSVDKTIARLQKQIELQRAVERKRADEAALAPAPDPGMDADVMADRIATQMTAIAELGAKVKESLMLGVATMSEIPTLWVDAIIGGWVNEAQRIVNAVKATMAEVNRAMTPPGGGGGFGGGGLFNVAPDAINRFRGGPQNSPPMDLSSASASQPSGMATGGFAGGSQAKEFNDNRRVHMDIHNNVDMDNVQRQIGLTLSEVNMGSGDEI